LVCHALLQIAMDMAGRHTILNARDHLNLMIPKKILIWGSIPPEPRAGPIPAAYIFRNAASSR
ncbi:MAG: hypothetical protein KJ573_15045, partial [Proteobacteria bacterium]|nr:hypothetical protein [Pseudomonadota bacterium]